MLLDLAGTPGSNKRNCKTPKLGRKNGGGKTTEDLENSTLLRENDCSSVKLDTGRRTFRDEKNFATETTKSCRPQYITSVLIYINFYDDEENIHIKVDTLGGSCEEFF